MEKLYRDLSTYSKDQLIKEVLKLRNAIRMHRDSSLHELCWCHPELWSLLTERVEQKPNSPRSKKEFNNNYKEDGDKIWAT